MDAVWTYIKANWKTNLAALAMFAYSVPQFVAAIAAWQAGQKPDWRGAVIGLIAAAGLLAAKDGTNHSTIPQVQAATVEAEAAAKPAVWGKP
jgi:drug/metabolite transporter (DMT)-like permease